MYNEYSKYLRTYDLESGLFLRITNLSKNKNSVLIKKQEDNTYVFILMYDESLDYYIDLLNYPNEDVIHAKNIENMMYKLKLKIEKNDDKFTLIPYKDFIRESFGEFVYNNQEIRIEEPSKYDELINIIALIAVIIWTFSLVLFAKHISVPIPIVVTIGLLPGVILVYLLTHVGSVLFIGFLFSFLTGLFASLINFLYELF